MSWLAILPGSMYSIQVIRGSVRAGKISGGAAVLHGILQFLFLADVLDALLSKRPYKDAWTPESAFEYIDGESGRHFDPRVVQAFDRCRDRLLAVKRQAR